MSRLLQIYREAGQRAIPVEVMLELTHHCNFRCQHCYIPDFLTPDLLPTARVLRLLDELAEMGTLVLALSGGEIFLRRDWLPIARRARELGFDLHLFTNGWAIGEAEADAIRDLSATVQVSLYSTEAATFDAITRRPGSLQRVRAGIEHLCARGVRVILKMPLMTLNVDDVAGVRAYAAALGVECRVAPMITARKDGDPTPLALRLSHQLVQEAVGEPLLGCHPKDLDGPLCAAGSRYCCITSAGDVMACNILPGSGGNIRDRPFRAVWEGSEWLQRIRSIRRHDLPTCGSCTRLGYCGRCQAQALVEDGDLYGPSRYAQQRADLIDETRAAGSR